MHQSAILISIDSKANSSLVIDRNDFWKMLNGIEYELYRDGITVDKIEQRDYIVEKISI